MSESRHIGSSARWALVLTLALLCALLAAPRAGAQGLLASTSAERVLRHNAPLAAGAADSADAAATKLSEESGEAESAEPQIPNPPQAAQAPVPPTAPDRFLGRFEVSQWGSAVSNDFGQWYGGGVHLYLDPHPRFSMMLEGFYERRPGEVEQGGQIGTTIHLTPWFYTSLAVSGGGPDDSAAFIPRLRYDVNGALAPGIPGFRLTGGWTRLAYGNPVSGRILRAGFLQYAGKFVVQGTVNFNNNRPGNHKSVDGVGSLQYGQEGRYWVGFVAGGGREAWQTQGLFPSNVEFDGYNFSAFTRFWLTRSFGMGLRYNHYNKKDAYYSNGAEVRLFWQF